MNSAPQITSQQSLCLSCGLCCDGTLFGKVPLKPEDPLPVLRDAGIQIQTKEINKSFKQPCVAFQKGCCQIYAGRPTNCRKYRCKLLKKYEAGIISREEAERKINRALELRENARTEIARILPETDQISIPAILKITPKNEEMLADADLLKKWGTIMMGLAALMGCLQDHFQLPAKKTTDSEKS